MRTAQPLAAAAAAAAAPAPAGRTHLPPGGSASGLRRTHPHAHPRPPARALRSPRGAAAAFGSQPNPHLSLGYRKGAQPQFFKIGPSD